MASMTLKFTKMHGLGNDFMVVDNRQQVMPLEATMLTKLAKRKTGVGFDQLLLVEYPEHSDSQFKYRIFNADGTEVSQCGNGARCFAHFVRDQGLCNANDFWVETNAGRIKLSLREDGQVQVNMGIPSFEPDQIPMVAAQREPFYPLDFDGATVEFMAAQIGNPHAIFQLGPVDDAPVAELGAHLQNHSLFPERVNVGFMHILSPTEIDLRVFERGVGETLACGSGACAAVACAIVNDLCETSVKVNVRGGQLNIDYAGEGEASFLTGPATTVYQGELNL